MTRAERIANWRISADVLHAALERMKLRCRKSDITTVQVTLCSKEEAVEDVAHRLYQTECLLAMANQKLAQEWVEPKTYTSDGTST